MTNARCLAALLPIIVMLCSCVSENEPNDNPFLAMDNPLHKELIASNMNGFNGILPDSDDRDYWWIMPEIGRVPDNSAMLVVTTQTSPLTVIDTRNNLPAGGVELSFDRNKYEMIKRLASEFGQVHLTNFALDQHTRTELLLKPISVLAPDATIVVAKTVDGVVEEREVDPPDTLVLKGWVKGSEESQVFLAISPLGTNGWIYADGTPGSSAQFMEPKAHGRFAERQLTIQPRSPYRETSNAKSGVFPARRSRTPLTHTVEGRAALADMMSRSTQTTSISTCSKGKSRSLLPMPWPILVPRILSSKTRMPLSRSPT